MSVALPSASTREWYALTLRQDQGGSAQNCRLSARERAAARTPFRGAKGDNHFLSHALLTLAVNALAAAGSSLKCSRRKSGELTSAHSRSRLASSRSFALLRCFVAWS